MCRAYTYTRQSEQYVYIYIYIYMYMYVYALEGAAVGRRPGPLCMRGRLERARGLPAPQLPAPLLPRSS